jgi:hypothetical protein
MKFGHIYTITLIVLLAIQVSVSQKTWIDKEQEELEDNAIEREHECRFQMSDGQHLTLRNLRKRRAPDYVFKNSFEDQEYTYYYNVCGPTIMTCNGEEDAVAMQKIGPECSAILARGAPAKAEYIDEHSPQKGVKIRYEGGEICEIGERKVDFILKCDPNIELETESVEETETCMYTFTLRTKYTCDFYPTRQDMFNRETELDVEPTYVQRRNKSIWSKDIVKIMFFCILAFLILNMYLFYQNLKRDPYRNYSRAIPFREKYRQVYRMVANKF